MSVLSHARLPSGPTGLGTLGLRVTPPPASGVPELYCPPPLRDRPELGELVNEGLVAWADEVGIYPGRLDELRSTGFGRLLMLTHPDTDDADRLLAAGKCALAEWAVDDHYCDDESAGAAADQVGARLGLAYAATEPAGLPGGYEHASREDPVLRAVRSALEHLVRYAGPAQVNRLRHEVAALWMGCNAEASWRTAGRLPPVWEYLTNRQSNSFRPMMALIDAVGGYELPAQVYGRPAVRSALTTAATAGTLVNDLYSMARESRAGGLDLNLPTVIAAEEKCSLRAAVERSAAIHDELMHTFEDDAAALSSSGPPPLQRFLAEVWAWLGGNLEWHRSTDRYANA